MINKTIRFSFFTLLFVAFIFGHSANAQNLEQGSSTEEIGPQIESLNVDLSQTKDEIISQFKLDLSDVIGNLSTSVSPEELNAIVEADRISLINKISSVFDGGVGEFVNKKDFLIKDVDTSISAISLVLSKKTGSTVSLKEAGDSIKDVINEEYDRTNTLYKDLQKAHVDLMYTDTDGDGISDYDEVYVYKTDPKKAKTVAGEKTDGQKILEGINPMSTNGDVIAYADPKTSGELVENTFSITDISLSKEGKEKINLSGTALPNSIVTLFIYSTPVIVSVKSNGLGEWKYSLDKELENGEHNVYVATVDTAGKILAKSSPFLFTKTAEAATLGGAVSTTKSGDDYSILLIAIISIFIIVIVLAVLMLGNKKTETETVVNVEELPKK